MEQTQQIQVLNHEQVKSLLANTQLLKFVRKFGCDNMLDNPIEMAEKLGRETNPTTIGMLDDTQVKGIFTDAKVKGKVYAKFNAEQLKHLIDIIGDEGKLVITEKKDNKESLLFGITENKNVIVVAPMVDEDEYC